MLDYIFAILCLFAMLFILYASSHPSDARILVSYFAAMVPIAIAQLAGIMSIFN